MQAILFSSIAQALSSPLFGKSLTMFAHRFIAETAMRERGTAGLAENGKHNDVSNLGGLRVAAFAFKQESDTYRPEENPSRYGIAYPSHDGFQQIPYTPSADGWLKCS